MSCRCQRRSVSGGDDRGDLAQPMTAQTVRPHGQPAPVVIGQCNRRPRNCRRRPQFSATRERSTSRSWKKWVENSRQHNRDRELRCRLFHVQNRRKPLQCHATIVSGLTMCTVERQRAMPARARPQHPICERQTNTARSIDHRELVAKDDDLRMQRCAGAESAASEAAR
jgi:hypothetical protein